MTSACLLAFSTLKFNFDAKLNGQFNLVFLTFLLINWEVKDEYIVQRNEVSYIVAIKVSTLPNPKQA